MTICETNSNDDWQWMTEVVIDRNYLLLLFIIEEVLWEYYYYWEYS